MILVDLSGICGVPASKWLKQICVPAVRSEQFIVVANITNRSTSAALGTDMQGLPERISRRMDIAVHDALAQQGV